MFTNTLFVDLLIIISRTTTRTQSNTNNTKKEEEERLLMKVLLITPMKITILLSSKDEREKEKPATAQEETLVIGGADADAFNEKGTKKWTPEQEGFLLSTYNSELAERTGAGGPNTAISMTPLWNAVCKTFNSDSRGKKIRSVQL